MTDTRRIQDQPLDQSTEGTPQQFDDDGYVVGHPHHEHVTSDDLSPDGHLIGEAATDGPDEPALETDPEVIEAPDAPSSAEVPAVAGLSGRSELGDDVDETPAPDGQFDSQDMPTTDGEPAEPEGEVLDDDEASIAPPPASPDPGPEVPGGPDLTPPEPGAPTPPEPAPFAPEEADAHGGQPPLLGDRVL